MKKIKANYFSELFKYEKFFLVLLTFIIFLLSTQKAFSLNLWDCKKDENVDYQTLINEFEKSSKVWINSKNYNWLFNDLWAITSCYDKTNQKSEFVKKFEDLIDQKIISEETYTNWIDDDAFKKSDWSHVFFYYYFYKLNLIKTDVLGEDYPRSVKDWNYIKILLDILNLEKEKNIEAIIDLTKFTYLEKDYDLEFSSEILEYINDYIDFTFKNNNFEYFMQFSRQKIQFLYKLNIKQCSDYYNNDFSKKFSLIDLKKLKNKPSPTLIFETYKEIADIHETAFYCNEYSYAYAEKYINILNFLISQNNEKDTIQQFQRAHLRVIWWLFKNFNITGNEQKALLYTDKYEKLLSVYDFSDYEKIKFELYKIKNDPRYLKSQNNEKNLTLVEQEVFNLLNRLSETSLEEQKKVDIYSDEKTFSYEKEKLKLELLSVHSTILKQTGRKIEAVQILKKQIKFYESLRTKNPYDVYFNESEIEFYEDTSQTLPSLYHEILFLFNDLRDIEEFEKYSNDAFNLCEILEKNKNNKDCYRVYLSYLNSVQNFKQDFIKKNFKKILSVINRVDKHWINFVNDHKYSFYTPQLKATHENQYIWGSKFPLFKIMNVYGPDKFIKFEYRKQQTVYEEICINQEWTEKYIKNSKISNINYKAVDLGILALTTACLINQDDLAENIPKKTTKSMFDMINHFMIQYEKDNKNKKYIYLDKTDVTDDTIYITGILYEILKETNHIDHEEIKKLGIKIFENLQFEESAFYVKTRKNFLRNFVNNEIKQLIEERRKLKIIYANLVNKIYNETNLGLNKKLNNNKFNIETRLKEIDQIISNKYPEFSNINKTKIFELKEIQAKLNNDEVLLYLINNSAFQGFVISKENFESFYNLGSQFKDGGFQNFVKNIRSTVFKSDFKYNIFRKNESAFLYQHLFNSINKLNKYKKTIYIIADKHFSGFPFEMLITNRSFSKENFEEKFNKDFEPRYLIEDYNIKYLPNIDTFMTLDRSNKIMLTSNSNFLGVGDPKFKKISNKNIISEEEITFTRGGFIEDTEIINERYLELPFTLKELNSIKKLFNESTILTKEKANENKVKKLDLKRYDIISFATHGEVSGTFKDFNEPFLVLTPPDIPNQNNDGLLTTSEISELNLDAELVILSACNTSSKIHKYASGFSGLINSFFAAGSKSVIATHWPVVDEAGYLLMSETLKKVINSNLSISKALQETKIEFINGKHGEEFKKPMFWAPYVYVGI